MASTNSFDAHGTLEVGDQSYEIYRLASVDGSANLLTIHRTLEVRDAKGIANRLHALRKQPRVLPARKAHAQVWGHLDPQGLRK